MDLLNRWIATWRQARGLGREEWKRLVAKWLGEWNAPIMLAQRDPDLDEVGEAQPGLPGKGLIWADARVVKWSGLQIRCASFVGSNPTPPFAMHNVVRANPAYAAGFFVELSWFVMQPITQSIMRITLGTWT